MKTERPALGPLTARLAEVLTPPTNTSAPADQNETAPAQGPYGMGEESAQPPADGPAEDLGAHRPRP
ncbi:hypothetical protein ABZ896_22820 [Streptomyces sp. NPDC047072]|uniref:hypothetical protein n=1 Tax=Streptomyces sp. NPDC047072 TaxID=3154809 RepID=UPI0033CE2E8C